MKTKAIAPPFTLRQSMLRIFKNKVMKRLIHNVKENDQEDNM